MLSNVLHIVCPMHLQNLKLLRQKVYDEMHLQKIHSLTQNFAQYPLHHATYSAKKVEVATSNGLVGATFL